MCFSVEIKKKESFYLLSLRSLSRWFCSFNSFTFFRSCIMIISIISAIGNIIGAKAKRIDPIFYTPFLL